MEQLSGPALALDLPGWGRSERPEDFGYTMDGLAAHVEGFLEALDVGDHHLVVHDWGSVGLIAAQARARPRQARRRDQRRARSSRATAGTGSRACGAAAASASCSTSLRRDAPPGC